MGRHLVSAFEHRSSVSADGTTIAYRQYGAGPGVVVVHGGMQAAHNHAKLAELLSADFTVYLVERRGRGKSGPLGRGFNAEKARQDLAAVVTATDARMMFAVSSGATIALYTALIEPKIERLALYEPPLSVFRPMAGPWFDRYEREVDHGDLAAAMVTLLKSDLGIETRLKVLPRFMLERLFRIAIDEDAKKADASRVPLGEIIPTFRYDALVVEEVSAHLDELTGLAADVLLLSGAKSPAYLHAITEYLDRRLARTRRIDLPGVGHLAAENDGRPRLVADALREFFR